MDKNGKRCAALYDKALVHKSSVVLDTLHKLGFDILNHPPYSADLASNDYYFFPKIKKKNAKR